jgi:dUTP pyrophosphatase
MSTINYYAIDPAIKVSPIKPQTQEAAGADIAASETVVLLPGQVHKVKTNVRLDIPPGYFVSIRSRSGLASKGVFVANSPGTIDSDYTGEVIILLYNSRETSYKIEAGTRIAQLLPERAVDIGFSYNAGPYSKQTDRGEGGFGSTGTTS